MAHADRYDFHVLRTGLESLINLAFLSTLSLSSSRFIGSLAALLIFTYIDRIVRSNHRRGSDLFISPLPICVSIVPQSCFFPVFKYWWYSSDFPSLRSFVRSIHAGNGARHSANVRPMCDQTLLGDKTIDFMYPKLTIFNHSN